MSRKTENRRDRITSFLKGLILTFTLLSLLVPLIINTKMFFPFNSPRALYFMAMVQIVFFAWLVLAVYDKNYRPKLNPVTISVSLFIFSMVLVTIFGYNSSLSFWSNHERMTGLLMFLHLFAFFIALSSTFKRGKEWGIILGSSAVVAAIVSVIGIVDNYGLVSFKHNFSGGSTLANTSFMGTYLLLASFLALYLFLRKEGKWKIFYGLNFLLVSLGVILNPGGRAMKGSLFAGLVLILLLYLAFTYRNKIIQQITRIAIAAGAVLFSVIGLMVFREGSFIRERVLGFHGMPGRLAVWETAWRGFLDRPFLGWGLESFDMAFLKHFNPKLFLPEYGQEIWFDKAHNVVFDFLSATGAIGTLFFFGIFVTAILILWKRYLKEDRIDFLAPVVFTSLFAAYFIQNLTVFDMVSSYAVLFLAFAFIVFLSSDDEYQYREKRFNCLSLLILIPFGFCLFLFVIQPYKSNTAFLSSLRFAPLSPERMVYSQKALDYSPLGREQIRRHILETNTLTYRKSIEDVSKKIAEAETREEKEMLRDFLAEGKKEIERNLSFGMQELKKNIEESPHFRDYRALGNAYNVYFNFYYLERLALSPEETALFEEAKETILKAEKYIEKAIEFSPRNNLGYWEMAEAKLNYGKIYFLLGEDDKSEEKFREAVKWAEKSIELEPLNFDSHRKTVSLVVVLLKDKELAEEKIARAVEINPLWEETLREI